MTKNQYAIAIFELASEDKKIEDLKASFDAFMEIYSSDKDFNQVFNSPKLKALEKKNLINKAFASLYQDFIYFLNVLIDNGRENELENIYRDFKDLLNEAKKLKVVTIYSKDKLSLEEEQEIKNSLRSIYASYEIEIKNILDDKIIGGYKIYEDGKLLDLSLKTKLDNLKSSI